MANRTLDDAPSLMVPTWAMPLPAVQDRKIDLRANEDRSLTLVPVPSSKVALGLSALTIVPGVVGVYLALAEMYKIVKGPVGLAIWCRQPGSWSSGSPSSSSSRRVRPGVGSDRPVGRPGRLPGTAVRVPTQADGQEVDLDGRRRLRPVDLWRVPLDDGGNRGRRPQVLRPGPVPFLPDESGAGGRRPGADQPGQPLRLAMDAAGREDDRRPSRRSRLGSALPRRLSGSDSDHSTVAFGGASNALKAAGRSADRRAVVEDDAVCGTGSTRRRGGRSRPIPSGRSRASRRGWRRRGRSRGRARWSGSGSSTGG